MHSNKRLSLWLILGGIAILSWLDHSGFFGYQGDDRTRFDGATLTVKTVIDGDTIEVNAPDGNRAETRVRLLGIYCPKIANGELEQVTDAGPDAGAFLREQFEGQPVRLALDPNRRTRDRQGRLLAYVYPADRDELLNLVLIREGLARADARCEHVMSQRFARAEKVAIQSRTGLWAGSDPESTAVSSRISGPSPPTPAIDLPPGPPDRSRPRRGD